MCIRDRGALGEKLGNIPGLSDASALLSNPEGIAKGALGEKLGNIPGLSDASAIGKDLTNITGPAGDMIKKGDLSAIGDGDASIALKKMPDNNRAIAKEGEPDQINSSSGENVDQQNNMLAKDVNGLPVDSNTDPNTIQNNGNAIAESNGTSTCEITGELKIKKSENATDINGNVTNNEIPKTNPPNMYQIIDDNNTTNTTDKKDIK